MRPAHIHARGNPRAVRYAWAPGLICLLLPVIPIDGAEAQVSTIAGRVIADENGRPLPGTMVTLRETGYRVTTDESGRFVFAQAVPGTHWLEFAILGYAERTESVTVEADDIVELEVRLALSPIELPPITVSINSGNIAAWLAARGFAQRGLDGRAMLHLSFEELNRLHYGSLDAVVRNVPGVRIRRLVDGGSEIWLDPHPLTGEGSCKVSVYLNGSYVELGRLRLEVNPRSALGLWLRSHPFERGRPLRFDDLVTLQEIDGLELYGPEANPVAPDSTCATLLIWSSKLRPAVDEYLTGEVNGVAVDSRTGKTLEGVRVTIEETGLYAVSDSTGAFSIGSTLPGRYRVLAVYPNAEPWHADVEVAAYGIITLDLRLERRDNSPSGYPNVGQRTQAANSTSANIGSNAARLSPLAAAARERQ